MRRLALVLLSLSLGSASVGAAAAGGSVRVEIKNPNGAPVPDAVASLVPLDFTPELQPPTEPITIVQDGQEFDPYVTTVIVGASVVFLNRDNVQHHVYSQSTAKRFDIPLHKKNDVVPPTRFDKAGIVSLGCNIHDWMSAYVVVLATPHFARSGADGMVPIVGLPPGRYQLNVWHPRIKSMLNREVVVSAADVGTQVVSVTLNPDRRIRRAPEGGAGSYK